MGVNTLGKKERLKSRKLITELFKSGKGLNIFPFRVVYAMFSSDDKIPGPADTQVNVTTSTSFEGREQSLQAGFSVSTRHFKKAVDRNRIKRIMRESYRIQKSDLSRILQKKSKKLCFFFIFTGKVLPNHDFIEDKMKIVIEKLIKVIDESAG